VARRRYLRCSPLLGGPAGRPGHERHAAAGPERRRGRL